LGPNFFHDIVQHKHSPNRYKAAGGKYKVQNQTPIAKYFSLWNKTHKIYVQFSTHLSFKSLKHFLEDKKFHCKSASKMRQATTGRMASIVKIVSKPKTPST
jgi:hypothetical protein